MKKSTVVKTTIITSILILAMVINVMGVGTIGAYASYSDSRSGHAYAGDTRFYYYLSMDEFSAFAYLDANDQSELTLVGYVEFSALYDNERYNFAAGDQYGYSVSAGRQTPYLTRYSYTRYYVCSDTGSTYTSLHLEP
ncbi:MULTISPECIES: hypothetical protein [Clostridia]|jgi:hypothetical protein|uniref:hypothetical protein n=1 Tax=Clostridia TaxID=186801 RepID=UPI000E5D3B49|nr:hypothetical protein [Eubacterium sp. AF22-9]MCI7770345.1 hypothetical protein [Eubacterium sp.]RGS33315.1 hypothetical protein DWY02_04320 [Eubacterium sp. AF22-9]